MHVIALDNTLMFPGAVMPLQLRAPESRYIFGASLKWHVPFAILAGSAMATPHPMACAVYASRRLLNLAPLAPPGDVVLGLARVRLVRWLRETAPPTAEFIPTQDIEIPASGRAAVVDNLKSTANKIIDLLPIVPPEARQLLSLINEPGHLADILMANIDAMLEDKQQALETLDVAERCVLVHRLLAGQLDVLQLNERLASEGESIQAGLGKTGGLNE